MRIRDELTEQLAKVQGALGGIRENTQRTSESLGSFERAMTVAATVGTFLGNVLYDLARGAIRLLWGEFQRAIDLSAEFTNSFIGLQSIALAFGVDADAARAAAERLASDGLMKVSEAAQGLKNLLMSGFNLDQSIQLMNAFKDSAAFGRQASLDFGHAVVTATEGIKNQNSILVDNAGVTKNLSLILKEAGFSVQDLSRVSSDAKVRLALLNGILKETAAQTGDAERLTQTYSGQVSRLTTQYEFLLGTLGAAITENKTVATVIGLVADAVQDLNDDLVHQGQAFTLISDIIIGFVRGLALLVEGINFVGQGFLYAGTFVQAFMLGTAQAGQAIDGFLLKTLQGIAKIPGATTVISGLGAAIEALQYDYDLSGAKAFHYGEALDASGVRAQAFADFSHSLSGRLNQVADQLEKTRGQTIEFGAATGRTRTDVQGLAAELDEAAKKAKALTDELGGQKAIQAAQQWTAALAQIGGTSKISGENVTKFQKIVVEAVEAIERGAVDASDVIKRVGADTVQYWQVVTSTVRSDKMLQDMRNYIGESVSLYRHQETTLLGLTRDGLIPTIDRTKELGVAMMTAAPAMLRVTDNTELLRAEIERLKAEEHARKIQMLVGAFDDLGSVIGGSLGLVVSHVGGVIGALDAMHHRMETGSGVVEGWANRVTAAVQGAVSVWSATDPAQGGGALSGALAGMQAGAAFGPYGAAIGAGAGALIGWARSTGPDADELSAREAVAALHTDIMENAKLFLTLEHVLEAGGEQWKLVNISVREAYLAMGLTVEQAYRDLDRVNNASHYSAEEVERAAASIRAAFEGVGQAYQDWFEGVEKFNTGFEMRVDGFQQHIEAVKAAHDESAKFARDAVSAQQELIEQLAAGLAAGTTSHAEMAAARQHLAQLEIEYNDLAKNGSIEHRAELKLLQEEFDRVGQFAVMAFNQTLSSSGSLPMALGVVRDELVFLRDAAKEFGWESSTAIDELLRISDTIERNRDVFTSLDGLRLMVDGLGQAGLLTKEKFELFGADAVASLETLRLRGVDVDEAMLLMQPTLQALWEAQERLGIEAHGATGELLNQAEQMGLVGPEQKTVMEQLVTVMEDLRDVLRDEIPEALERFRQAGRGAAEDVAAAVDGITGAAGAAAAAMALIPAPSGANAGNYNNLRDMYPFMSAAQQAAIDQALAEQGYTLFHEGGTVYHEGGYIPRAHSGMFLGKRLAADEVPIIAQTGEAVLNRAATAAIGGEAGVNALNRGGAAGGCEVHIHVNVTGSIFGADSRQFQETVAGAVNKGLERSGEHWGRHERIVKQMVTSS